MGVRKNNHEIPNESELFFAVASHSAAVWGNDPILHANGGGMCKNDDIWLSGI